jgi:hypothetical protein
MPMTNCSISITNTAVRAGSRVSGLLPGVLAAVGAAVMLVGADETDL